MNTPVDAVALDTVLFFMPSTDCDVCRQSCQQRSTKWTLNLLKDNCATNGLNLEALLMFEKRCLLLKARLTRKGT